MESSNSNNKNYTEDSLGFRSISLGGKISKEEFAAVINEIKDHNDKLAKQLNIKVEDNYVELDINGSKRTSIVQEQIQPRTSYKVTGIESPRESYIGHEGETPYSIWDNTTPNRTSTVTIEKDNVNRTDITDNTESENKPNREEPSLEIINLSKSSSSTYTTKTNQRNTPIKSNIKTPVKSTRVKILEVIKGYIKTSIAIGTKNTKNKLISGTSICILLLGSLILISNKEANNLAIDAQISETNNFIVIPQEDLPNTPALNTESIKKFKSLISQRNTGIENTDLRLNPIFREIKPESSYIYFTLLENGVIPLGFDQNTNQEWLKNNGNNWVAIQVNKRKVPVVDEINIDGKYPQAHIISTKIIPVDSKTYASKEFENLTDEEKAKLDFSSATEVITNISQNDSSLIQFIESTKANNFGYIITNKLGETTTRGAVDNKGDLIASQSLSLELNINDKKIILKNNNTTGPTLSWTNLVFEGKREGKPYRILALVISSDHSPIINLIVFDLDNTNKNLVSDDKIRFKREDIKKISPGESNVIGKVLREGNIKGQFYRFILNEKEEIIPVDQGFTPELFSLDAE